VVAVEADGELADVFDEEENFFTVQGADGFAKDAAEQADVAVQGFVHRGWAVFGVYIVHSAIKP